LRPDQPSSSRPMLIGFFFFFFFFATNFIVAQSVPAQHRSLQRVESALIKASLYPKETENILSIQNI
ncbi:hypothetical protein, partial [Clostridium perfringens]